MCPPANPPSPAEFGAYWNDDQIILFLEEYSRGSRLPDNVLEDSSPYQYPPSNLPEGIWYLVRSNEKTESVLGFWKAKGEACKIYSNSAVSGWRTTLEYFEGTFPNGQRTDWLMQEYMITQKELHDKDKTKEPVFLCRVFLWSGHDSRSEPKQINSVASHIPNANITSCQDFRSELKEECEVALLPVADAKPNSSLEILSEQECFLRGDYLELNDLEDPESHSSSSQNSSCPSNLSDEYFDSLALIRDLEEEEKKYMEEQQSCSSYSFISPAEPNNVVMQPSDSLDFLLGSLLDGSSSNTSIVQSSQTDSTVQEMLTDERVMDHSTKRQKPESRNEETSNFSNMAMPFTSHTNATPNEEKKAGSGRLKKLKFYFCLASF